MKKTTLAIMLLLFVSTAHAKIYRWVDESGSVHFSDKPYSEEAEEIIINQTGIKLDQAPGEEDQEPPETAEPAQVSSPSAAKRSAVTTKKEPANDEEQAGDKIITEADYRISTTIGKLGGDLISISGRISSGPKCYDMSVVATATNDSGLSATIKDQVRKSNTFGSVTFKGTARATGSAEDRGFWKVDTVEIRCND